MKHCISKLISWISNLWRTVKEYVRKKTRNHIRFQDTDVDGIDEIIIDLNSTEYSDISMKSEFSVVQNNLIKEDNENDTKSDSR